MHLHNRGRRHALWPDLHCGEIAKRVGITRSHLSNILSGKSRPSLKVAIALAEVWSELMGRDIRVEDLEKEFQARRDAQL